MSDARRNVLGRLRRGRGRPGRFSLLCSAHADVRLEDVRVATVPLHRRRARGRAERLRHRVRPGARRATRRPRRRSDGGARRRRARLRAARPRRSASAPASWRGSRTTRSASADARQRLGAAQLTAGAAQPDRGAARMGATRRRRRGERRAGLADRAVDVHRARRLEALRQLPVDLDAPARRLARVHRRRRRRAVAGGVRAGLRADAGGRWPLHGAGTARPGRDRADPGAPAAAGRAPRQHRPNRLPGGVRRPRRAITGRARCRSSAARRSRADAAATASRRAARWSLAAAQARSADLGYSYGRYETRLAGRGRGAAAAARAGRVLRPRLAAQCLGAWQIVAQVDQPDGR